MESTGTRPLAVVTGASSGIGRELALMAGQDHVAAASMKKPGSGQQD
jgi:NAD(P)-dependent dehydrogenase (short-subunit alcohol dehydrogenase family)